MKPLVTVLFMLVSAAVGAQSVEPILTPSADDIIFYESFDKIEGTGGNDGTQIPGNTAITDMSLFDNSGTKSNGVLPGYQCIHIGYKLTSYYLTPKVNTMSEGKVILSFRMFGRRNYSNSSDFLTIDCTSGSSLSVSDFVAERETWNTYYTVVDKMTSTTQFTFKSGLSFFDDITMYAVPSTLDQSKNNNTYIIANADQTRDVELIRTLTPNTWCPLCLPFNVTQSQMEDVMETTCELRTLTDIRDGVFIFDEVTSVSAGMPFLVKVNTEVENPVFTGVTVVDTPAATATGSATGYSFVGTYSPVSLNTNGTHLFLDKEGNLCQPDLEEGYNRLNGLRAYFVVPESSGARVFISDTSAGVSHINKTPIVHYDTYDLNGRHIDTSFSKGLHIRNGRKFLIP